MLKELLDKPRVFQLGIRHEKQWSDRFRYDARCEGGFGALVVMDGRRHSADTGVRPEGTSLMALRLHGDGRHRSRKKRAWWRRKSGSA
jgi:hypothetical protein